MSIYRESEILIRQRHDISNKRSNLIRLRNNNTRIGSLLSGHRLFQHNPPFPDARRSGVPLRSSTDSGPSSRPAHCEQCATFRQKVMSLRLGVHLSKSRSVVSCVFRQRRCGSASMEPRLSASVLVPWHGVAIC